MKKLALGSTDQDILTSVMDWIGLLAAQKYAEAWNELWHPEEDDHWTQILMESSIASYGAPDDPPDEAYRVTEFGGNVPRNQIFRINHDVASPFQEAKYIAIVDADLPLDGEMSDLTATIQVYQFDGSLVLKLHDIHVM